MKGTRFLVLSAAIVSVALFIAGIGFAEDMAAPTSQEPQEQVQAPAEPVAESAVESTPAPEAMPVKTLETSEAIPAAADLETQWVWGEVTSLDPQNKQVTINYFDYETDAEKEVKLLIDDKTKYENINSLSDLKLHDTISVDYVLSADGQYNARNISVEKPEESAAPAEAATP
jgi:hypothetical protein